jgi:hypothetical protein
MSTAAFDAVLAGLMILAIVLAVIGVTDWTKAGRGRQQQRLMRNVEGEHVQ